MKISRLLSKSCRYLGVCLLIISVVKFNDNDFKVKSNISSFVFFIAGVLLFGVYVLNENHRKKD